MLATYRGILTRPGTALFSVTGLVARLPISMIGLGIVLLVEHATDSYGLAGSVSAAMLVGQAAFAIPQGRLLDRLGQPRVLPLVVTVWGAGLALMIWAVEEDWPIAAAYLLAAVSGAGLPAIGSCVRARWAHVLDSPRDVQTAFALEAVVDEVIFMTGPIIVTVLATTVHPIAGLGAALAAGVFGTLYFAAQRSTAPPPHPRPTTSAARPPVPWATVAPLTVVCLALGVLFGAAEVTAVAFAEEQDAKSYVGVLLALWAFGSLLAGAITGAITWRRDPVVRLRVGALGMAATMVPLPFIDSMWVMGLVLFAAGFAIAPTLIATMSLAEQVLPSSRLTEGMAFLHTGLIGGVAPGATLAGVVIDAHGASPSYLVSFGGGLLALAAALLTRTTVSSHDAVD
ncbi:MAG TPA: MFS transporter [Nocardioides sp.]|nr:MFS transporter [Nocardioides sp.]